MRCASCHQPIDPSRADDRGLLRCACGAEIELEDRRKVRPLPVEAATPTPPDPAREIDGDPYRSASTGSTPARELPLDLASLSRDASRCPRCSHPLVPLEEETGCRGCAGCGGVFVELEALLRPRQELQGVVEPRATIPARDVSAYVCCPVCGEMMRRTVFGRRSGVVVDVCTAHGTWFDHGELVRALEFLERGGLERADEDEARKDASPPRVAVELDASLVAGAVREGARVGRWQGMLATRRWSLIDALLDLLE